MARIVYSVIFYLLTPFICLRLWWRGRKVPGYRRRWRERFGFIASPPPGKELIWIHSVSVGETIAAVPMIRRLQTLYPDCTIAVTTTTPTGSDRVRAMLGDSVYHCYAPYDLPGAVCRTLRRLRPRCLIIMETELWPNLIHYCARSGIPVVVANARLSERSSRGYRRFGSLTTPMLGKIAAVAAQYAEDGERFLQLGLQSRQLVTTGNIKFDLEFSAAQHRDAERLSEAWRGMQNRPVWLAASTHQGEEAIILDAFAQVRSACPDLLLVLVPRHPDRFDAVAELCRQRGFDTVRRSLGETPDDGTEILLGDTMGELQVFYGACDLAFVGGSLVPVGGHNLLEPAAWGKAVISGPHLFNFAEVSSLLQQAGGLTLCSDADSTASAVLEMLQRPGTLTERGSAAHSVVENNRGAMDKLLTIVSRQMA